MPCNCLFSLKERVGAPFYINVRCCSRIAVAGANVP